MTHAIIRSEPQQYFFDSSFQMFLLDRKVQRVSSHTIRFYTTLIRPFLIWCADAQNIRDLGAIKPTHIRAHLLALHERELSSNSVHAAARALRAFFNFCVREELLTTSPMTKVTMPKVDRPILPSFEVADIEKMLKACKRAREQAIVLVLLDTGCRAAELLNLNGGDIDVPQGIVHIRKGKGGKDRIAYLGNRSRKMMLRYYLERGQPGETEPVWVHAKRGTRLTDSGLRQLFERLGIASGVNHCHPHTFRRTFALWSLRNGMSIYHLQRLMGHSDLTVLRQYLALVESDLKAAHVRYGAVDNMIG